MSAKTLLSSKVVIVLLLVFLGLMADLKYKQFKNQKAIETEKLQLSRQIDSLQKSNSDLSQSLDYINSEDFKERAARGELNMQKRGELVYNFTVNPSSSGTNGQQGPAKSNLKKWWEYFTASGN